MQRKYTVSPAGNRIIIIDYMSGFLGFSSRQTKKLIKDKKIYINGKTAYRDSKLKYGDIVEVDLSEEPRKDIQAEDIEISVIYEDEYILAVNKPPFMLVHPTPNHSSGTLLNAAANYFEKKGDKVVLRLLNRLDMNTSGIVVIPKNAEIHNKLYKMMNSGKIKKFYLAVIEGIIEPEEGIINKPIGKLESDCIRRTVKIDGQMAITVYKTLEKYKDHSLVSLEILTGRTHQIRVHLSNLGYPIIGDVLYGKESCFIGRQALHASDMEFPHPEGLGIIKLHAEMPGDMLELIIKCSED